MSDEEKKAIEILKEIKDVRGIRQDVKGENEDLQALNIVYNLIKKQDNKIKFFIENEIALKEMNRNQMKTIEDQQKEIAKEKEKNRHLEIDKSQLKAYIETCCINKTKIEKKIYELEEIADEDNPDIYIKIDAYKELLEGNENE